MKETVWCFSTDKFTVALRIECDFQHLYDGDDNGDIQSKLDSGELVAFNSQVDVCLNGTVIGSAYLSDSIYAADEVDLFWTAHRDSHSMDRNCSTMREARGANVSISHYFPGMVKEAIQEARRFLASAPGLRLGAIE